MIYKKVFQASKAIYYGEEHYDMIINDDAVGYKEDGSILFIFKKNIIPEEQRKNYLKICRSQAKTKTKNRGAGSGFVDVKKFPPQAVSLCNKHGAELKNKNILSAYFKYEDGHMTKRCQSNQVRCGVAGYFDDVAGLGCRKVGWSARNDTKHKELINLCDTISNHYKEVAPVQYEYQKNKVNKDFNMGDSIFSTLTLNYDFMTACHQDKGDLVGSLSTLTILEELEDNYDGFYTGLPEYKLMFDIRDGDCLIFDAHEYHCNTEYNVKTDKLPIDDLTGKPFAGRLSIVAYLRDAINLCGD